MNILALDVATKCGWCTASGSGTWDFSLKRDDSGGIRIIKFIQKLKETVIDDRIDLIVFERTAGFHKSALIIQAEMHGAMKQFCHDSGIEYRAYSASEIKKFATGKGNAKKDQMIEAAIKTYGVTPGDDNEADAIHIYHLAMRDFNASKGKAVR